MTDYVKSTNFASKDSLAVGNPLKIVKGTEIDGEFNNIATAVATKADIVSPTFTGTVTGTFIGDITGNATTVTTITTAQTLTAIADASAGAVGTYMFAVTTLTIPVSSGIGPGNTVAGSALYPASVRQPQLGGSISLSSTPLGSALSGTWRMMGANYNADPSFSRLDATYTLWLRII